MGRSRELQPPVDMDGAFALRVCVCAHVGEHAFKVTQASTERGGACYCACQAPAGDLPKLGACNRFLGLAHDLKARILRAEGAEICFFNKFSCGFQV